MRKLLSLLGGLTGLSVLVEKFDSKPDVAEAVVYILKANPNEQMVVVLSIGAVAYAAIDLFGDGVLSVISRCKVALRKSRRKARTRKIMQVELAPEATSKQVGKGKESPEEAHTPKSPMDA